MEELRRVLLDPAVDPQSLENRLFLELFEIDTFRRQTQMDRDDRAVAAAPEIAQLQQAGCWTGSARAPCGTVSSSMS